MTFLSLVEFVEEQIRTNCVLQQYREDTQTQAQIQVTERTKYIIFHMLRFHRIVSYLLKIQV